MRARPLCVTWGICITCAIRNLSWNVRCSGISPLFSGDQKLEKQGPWLRLLGFQWFRCKSLAIGALIAATYWILIEIRQEMPPPSARIRCLNSCSLSKLIRFLRAYTRTGHFFWPPKFRVLGNLSQYMLSLDLWTFSGKIWWTYGSLEELHTFLEVFAIRLESREASWENDESCASFLLDQLLRLPFLMPPMIFGNRPNRCLAFQEWGDLDTWIRIYNSSSFSYWFRVSTLNAWIRMWLVSGDIRHLAYDAYGHGERPELLDLYVALHVAQSC